MDDPDVSRTPQEGRESYLLVMSWADPTGKGLMGEGRVPSWLLLRPLKVSMGKQDTLGIPLDGRASPESDNGYQRTSHSTHFWNPGSLEEEKNSLNF